MTLERRVASGELGGNTQAFRNYAVAYCDARGARTYARVWSTAPPGIDGPVDNRASACMSCHITAQAPSLANILPPTSGVCLPQRPSWFRNLPGSTPFGRFDPNGTCQTSLNGITLTAADYSLQLSDTVSRAVAGPATFNPCTWDDAAPPSAAPPTPDGPAASERGVKPRVFPVTRDPAPIK